MQSRIQCDSQLGIGCETGSSAFPEMSPPWYCLGLFKTEYRGKDIFWHSGSGPGSGSIFVWLPAEKVGLAVCTNTMPGGYQCGFPLVLHYLDKLFGFPEIDWTARIENLPDCQNDSMPEMPAVDRLHPSPLPFNQLCGEYGHPATGKICLFEPSTTSDNLPVYATEVRAMVRRAETFGPVFQSRAPDLLMFIKARPLFFGFGYARLWHVTDGLFWGNVHYLVDASSKCVDITQAVVESRESALTPVMAFDQSGTTLSWYRNWSDARSSPNRRPRVVLRKTVSK